VFPFNDPVSDPHDAVKHAKSGDDFERELFPFPANSPTVTHSGRLVVVDDHSTFDAVFGNG